MIDSSSTTKKLFSGLIVILFIIGCLQLLISQAYAKEYSITVKGNIYEFPSNAHYEFSSASTSTGSSFGSFTISGSLKSTGDKNGIPAYSVSSESANFQYTYSQSRLNVSETEWHLIDDKTKKVDEVSLDKNILSGAIIIQSSKNGVDWITDVTMTDIFAKRAKKKKEGADV